jgi:hypothetical protein
MGIAHSFPGIPQQGYTTVLCYHKLLATCGWLQMHAVCVCIALLLYGCSGVDMVPWGGLHVVDRQILPGSKWLGQWLVHHSCSSYVVGQAVVQATA